MYLNFGVPLALDDHRDRLRGRDVRACRSCSRRNNPYDRKLIPYECGEPPTGRAWINFNVRFYLIALIFVVFEVEVAFVYPIAAVYLDWVRSGRRLVRAQRDFGFPADPVRGPGLRLGQARPRMDQKSTGIEN